MRISHAIVSTQIYDKSVYIDFEMVNFPFSNGQLFAIIPKELMFLNSSNSLGHLAMLQCPMLAISQKLLKECFCYYKLRKAFS